MTDARLAWGWVPRGMRERGVLTDAQGSFRMHAGDCPKCRRQIAQAVNVGSKVVCVCGAGMETYRR